MDDFLNSLPLRDHEKKRTAAIDPAELRLLYVALTRAKVALDMPPPLKVFIDTGVLPASADVDAPPRRTQARPSPRETQQAANQLAQLRADWEPPAQQRPVQEKRAEACPEPTNPAPIRPKKQGFLRRLFGG